MTAQGSAYTRLDRALATGDPLIVRMAAIECPRLSTADALRIVLVHASADRVRYPRLAARWVGKVAREQPLALGDLDALVGALLDLGQDYVAGCRSLEDAAMELGLADVAAAVRRHAPAA
ncbi:MAG: hypothetical protein JHD16_00045 [Solirubrobacteraceae bacterium]|nr:hypothetical protein [Solirubrobacteraceae bacterium]